MSKTMKVLLSLSVFCFLVIGITWTSQSSKVQSQSKLKPEIQDQSGTERIEAKARSVKGSDKEAIQNLTAEIMTQYGWGNAPSLISNSVKNRIVNAEQKFQDGNGQGITELAVARALNGLVVKFKAPVYASTSPSEVRELRGRLLAFLPDLIGRGRAADGHERAKAPHSPIALMSPVEAAYVAMTMIHQKMNNPEFQMTQSERRAAWIEKHSKTPDSVVAKGSPPSGAPTARQKEMASVIQRAVKTIPQQNLFSLPDQVLDALGIER